MTKTHTHSAADSEAFSAALEQLAATARTAIRYVGYANDSTREREALSWIRKKHEELLALAERFEKSKRYACLQAPTQREADFTFDAEDCDLIAKVLRAAAQPAMGLEDVADIIRDKVYADENDKVGGVYDAAQKAAQPPAAPVETDAPAWHGVQDAIDAWAQKTLGEDAGVIMSWSDRLAQHLAPALPRLSADTAIAALAKRFWSIHPSTLDDMGLTREEFYASEMVKLFGALTRNEPQTAGMTAPREMYVMLYLHYWAPPKEGQEHRWEPGKNVFPAIQGVYETIRDANAVLSRMSDPKKYWVCRVWLPAHDTSSMTRPQSNTGEAS